MYELIFTSKKQEKKSAGREWIVQHSPWILSSEEKATTAVYTVMFCALKMDTGPSITAMENLRTVYTDVWSRLLFADEAARTVMWLSDWE